MRTFDHEMASHDPSEIPFAGLAVDVIEFYGGLLYLHAHGDPGHLRLQISGEFGLSGPGVEDAAVRRSDMVGCWLI